jgi:pilus assembly protein Flp/PilA
MLNELSARIMTWAMQARDNEEGQGLVEYALILSVVAVGAIATLGLVGDQIDGVFQDILSAFTG